MLPLLGYILNHLRTLQISLIGFFVIYFILERTAGLRYGRAFSLFLWSLVWMYRYFGVSLYVSTYLARDHMGDLWFEEFLLLLMLINIGIGISAIALVFKGNLQKNLIVEMIFEITYSLAYFMGMMVVYSGTDKWTAGKVTTTFGIPQNITFMKRCGKVKPESLKNLHHDFILMFIYV